MAGLAGKHIPFVSLLEGDCSELHVVMKDCMIYMYESTDHQDSMPPLVLERYWNRRGCSTYLSLVHRSHNPFEQRLLLYKHQKLM